MTNRCVSSCALLGAALLAAPIAAAFGGEPHVRIDSDPVLNASHVRASIDIAAPPAAVWKVLTDCAHAPQIVPNLESCRVLKHDPAGHWEVRENVINPPLLPRIRTVSHNDFETARRLSFHRIEGDMRVSEGEWRLDPVAGGTHLSYDARFAPDFFAPKFLVRQAVNRDFPKLLRALERASIAEAGKS